MFVNVVINKVFLADSHEVLAIFLFQSGAGIGIA